MSGKFAAVVVPAGQLEPFTTLSILSEKQYRIYPTLHSRVESIPLYTLINYNSWCFQTEKFSARYFYKILRTFPSELQPSYESDFSLIWLAIAFPKCELEEQVELKILLVGNRFQHEPEPRGSCNIASEQCLTMFYQCITKTVMVTPIHPVLHTGKVNLCIGPAIPRWHKSRGLHWNNLRNLMNLSLFEIVKVFLGPAEFIQNHRAVSL